MDNISADREDLQLWSQDVRDTSVRLQSQRQRCQELPRDGKEQACSYVGCVTNLMFVDPPTAMQDRIIQACNAAWSASVAYELNRLYTDLIAIDPELAAELRRKSGHCFPDAPEAPEVPEVLNFLRRVFNSAF